MSYFVEYEVNKIKNILMDELDPSNIKCLYNKTNNFEDLDREELLYYFVSNSKTPIDLLDEIYYKHLKVKTGARYRSLYVNLINNSNMKNLDILEDMLKHPQSDVRWYAVRKGLLSKETLERIYNQDMDFDVRYEAKKQLEILKK